MRRSSTVNTFKKSQSDFDTMMAQLRKYESPYIFAPTTIFYFLNYFQSDLQFHNYGHYQYSIDPRWNMWIIKSQR